MKLISPQFTRRQFLHRVGAAAALGIATCAIDATWFEARRPVVARVELAVPSLPRQLDGLTIAQLNPPGCSSVATPVRLPVLRPAA